MITENKKAYIFILIILLAAAVYKKYQEQKAYKDFIDTHPPIILISIDTLRADHLSCYGYQRKTSPNIDKFAKENILFLNGYSDGQWTLTSHASMFTGLAGSIIGVRDIFGKYEDKPDTDIHINPNIEFLPEYLKKIGYKSAGFTDGGYVLGKLGFSKGMDVYEDYNSGFSDNIILAKKFILKNKKRPLFLFLHTYDVHSPYYPKNPVNFKNKFLNYKYNGKFSDVSKLSNADTVHKSIYDIEYSDSVIYNFNRKDFQYLIDNYDNAVYHTDQLIGEFFNFLKEQGLYDKALIIFTADHGERFFPKKVEKELNNEIKYYMLHNDIYKEIIHIPLIIKLPGSRVSNTKKINDNISANRMIFHLIKYLINNKNSIHNYLKKFNNEYIVVRNYGGFRGKRTIFSIIYKDYQLMIYIRLAEFNNISSIIKNIYSLRLINLNTEKEIDDKEMTGYLLNLFKKELNIMYNKYKKIKTNKKWDSKEKYYRLRNELKKLGYIN